MVRSEPQMLKNAMNPQLWGMAKSLMMSAIEAGVDPADQAGFERFVADYNARIPARPAAARPPANPFRHLSRNAVIRVRYTDGSLREGKFKRLEADLAAGKCELALRN